jgi:hypothetical protein
MRLSPARPFPTSAIAAELIRSTIGRRNADLAAQRIWKSMLSTQAPLLSNLGKTLQYYCNGNGLLNSRRKLINATMSTAMKNANVANWLTTNGSSDYVGANAFSYHTVSVPIRQPAGHC